MGSAEYDVWREKGRMVGRQILATLDVMALEEAVRASSPSNANRDPQRHSQALAFRIGLRDALRECRQAAPER